MEGSAYKKGDKVRCLNETQPCVIVGISRDQSSYYYNIKYHGAGIVDRIPESGLVPYSDE